MRSYNLLRSPSGYEIFLTWSRLVRFPTTSFLHLTAPILIMFLTRPNWIRTVKGLGCFLTSDQQFEESIRKYRSLSQRIVEERKILHPVVTHLIKLDEELSKS